MRLNRLFCGAVVGAAVVFLSICSVSFAQSDDQIGKIIAAVGQVQAVQAGGAARALLRGSSVHLHETLRTGGDGFAQIRFSDNTLLSLKPDTEFRLDQYQLKSAQPKQDRYGATIVKGSFKMLTGAIGKHNPDQFRVTSRVATIITRGTGFMGHYSPRKQELSTGVFKGAIALAQCKGGAAPDFQGMCVCPPGSKEKTCLPEMMALTSVGGETAYGRATLSGLAELSGPPAQFRSGGFAPGGDKKAAREWQQQQMAAPASESSSGPTGISTSQDAVSIIEQQEAQDPVCEGSDCCGEGGCV